MQKFTVVVQTPETTTPAQRLSLGHLLSQCYARTWPEEPSLVPQTEAENLFHVPSDKWRSTLAIWDGQEAVAWAQLQGSFEQNTHWATLHLLTHPEKSSVDIELLHALWSAVKTEAHARGVQVIQTWAVDRMPAVSDFLQLEGFRLTLSNSSVRLILSDVSDELLQQWSNRPAEGTYRLHRWTKVPDDDLARVADLKCVNNDMPKGESEVGESTFTPQMIRDEEEQAAADGETRFLVVIEDQQNGELVAYSETFWGPARPTLVYQGGTAVQRTSRGIGLGKWVKADMVQWLREAAPGARYIKTNVAEENEAMNALNTALGFQPYATVTEWEVRLADLS